jgi:NADPH-dependent curcumin reductase CurA
MTANRQIIIDSLPEDTLAESNYQLQTAPMPKADVGEILCQTLAISISAGSRAGLQGSASYAGAPKTGIVMNGAAISRVQASKAPGIAEGDLVMCPAGWQEYSVHAAAHVSPVPDRDDPAHYLGALGTNGLTAYFGLLDVGKPKDGETVVVSAAAGSVGHLAGQIAKIKGCRVIGVAGSDKKCQLLVDQLGFDAAVNHRSEDFKQDFRAACSTGIDIYFDNTGGDILGRALFGMNNQGRIVCCGVVSQYDTSNPAAAPRGIPGLLVNKRLRMEGFLVFDFADRYEEARTALSQWMQSGELIALQDEFHGLEEAPRALVDLLAGGNTGTRVVRISD